jgi:branched-chain amino acid transport system permease protein
MSISMNPAKLKDAPKTSDDGSAGHGSERLNWHRIRIGEAMYWAAALAVFFLLPQYLAFATSVLVTALFVLSLDLILGFAGIISLGHALYFGFGAYVTGLVTFVGWTEPISGTVLGGVSAAALAAVTGPVVLRLTGLPLIMVTLALGVIAFEAANKLTWLTGGDDGLYGVTVAPLLGRFPWTMFAQTSYLYVLIWTFLMFVLARCVVASPFGVALQGIRDNSQRMRLIGTPVLSKLVQVYVISGFIAGVAGALSAQTTKFVGLAVLSLDTSVSGLVMLVLGGVGKLYGGLIGAPVYMIVHHFASQWNPYHWMFIIGALLTGVVMFARGGILGISAVLWKRLSRVGERS